MLRAAVKLDRYDGRIQYIQDRIPAGPESTLARKKMRDFLFQHVWSVSHENEGSRSNQSSAA
jgi:hypothetical protein